MTKKDFVRRVTEILKDGNARKVINVPSKVFTITDSEGGKATFKVKGKSKEVLFCDEDVDLMVDACIETILEAVSNGEEIKMSNIGILRVEMRKDHVVKHPTEGDIRIIPAHSYPRFFPSKRLKVAAKVFDMKNREARDDIAPFYDDDEEAFEDGDF